MSYERDVISRFCSATGKLHSSTLIFCPICKSGQEIVDLDSSPPSLPQSARTTQSTRIFPVAATERENVNMRIRNANSRPHAGTNALSTRNPSRTMQQLYSFSVILVLEEFCYSSLEDQEAKLQTVIRRKVHGMLLYLFYIVRYMLILIRRYFFQNPKLSIRIYRSLYQNSSLSFN
jgi:hypothetical protein